MKIQANETYILNILKTLLDTPSPSGFTRGIMTLIGREAEALGIPCSFNEKGGAILTLPGRDSSRRIALSAHVDTLGAMVRSITEKAR
ncbi:hypothetical protein HMSSN036_63820 [Paenibacillus macerans]|nr:hypothetical protein HMSSN036_63820 [Paenibacillus macerans]